MSFLNPVNEPVLRFKNTDAGAPQINYNARVAGDVKAVLKACLVTGYGTTASAGWTAANEVGNVIEFVSPSAAMSDYRLAVDDTSTSSTTWFYQYQGARINPVNNQPQKGLSFADKTHESNGWELIVTDRGLFFIELIRHSAISNTSARLTYFGQIKSALMDNGGANIGFYNVGHNATVTPPSNFFSSSNSGINLNDNTGLYIFGATPSVLGQSSYEYGQSNVDIVTALYLARNDKKVMVGEIVGMLSKTVNNIADAYGKSDTDVDGRPVLRITLGQATSNLQFAQEYARTMLIRLDYWEY